METNFLTKVAAALTVDISTVMIYDLSLELLKKETSTASSDQKLDEETKKLQISKYTS